MYICSLPLCKCDVWQLRQASGQRVFGDSFLMQEYKLHHKLKYNNFYCLLFQHSFTRTALTPERKQQKSEAGISNPHPETRLELLTEHPLCQRIGDHCLRLFWGAKLTGALVHTASSPKGGRPWSEDSRRTTCPTWASSRREEAPKRSCFSGTFKWLIFFLMLFVNNRSKPLFLPEASQPSECWKSRSPKLPWGAEMITLKA